MRKWLLISCLVVLAGGWACDRGEEGGEAVGQLQSENWPDEPSRVVSMAPTITELLFELGMGDQVVAVTRYCDWPDEAAELPTIGGMLDPDFEAILAVEPDVVVGVIDGADHGVVERLEGAGVAYGFVAMDGLESIREGIPVMGGWMEREGRAGELVEDFDTEIGAASKRLKSQRGDEERALMVFDREPIVAAGPGSYGDELLRAAGFENAVGADAGAYPVLDVEKLLALDPEVVIDVTIDADEAVGAAYWERFDRLDAVESGGLFHIDDPVMMRPGVRIPEALNTLYHALE